MTRDDRNRTWERGGFHWCVDHIDLGDPEVSRLTRVLCRQWTIWPEQLLGASGIPHAADSATYRTSPLSTGPCPEPNREGRVVYARRFLWRAVYERTDWSVENIAQMLGGYAVATVRPWALSWKPFERTYGRWVEHHDGSEFNSWVRFAPHMIELLGLAMPEAYAEYLDLPGRGLRNVHA